MKCWHCWPQGHCPISERLQTCTAEGFFSQKRASFPAKSTSFCKQHPCRHTAPSCFCTSHSPISHSRKNTISTYKLQISLRKRHMRYSDYIEILFPLCVTLKKRVFPKERDLWSCSYQECSLQLCWFGSTVMQEVHNFKAY